MLIKKSDIENFQSRYCAKFINSLAGIRQASLIGTRSLSGHSNLAIFNSLVHLGSSPALYGLVFRPNVVRRDTLNNILETKEFSINYVSVNDYKKAHQTSAKYEKNQSEFKEVGFTEVCLLDSKIPFIKEANVKIALKFEEKVNLTINQTILIIGSVQFIELDEKIIDEDGFVGLEKQENLVCSGLDAYYKTELLSRLSYAEVEK